LPSRRRPLPPRARDRARRRAHGWRRPRARHDAARSAGLPRCTDRRPRRTARPRRRPRERIHMTITPHLVVSDAGRAADWYAQALGAKERGRIEVRGGKLMQVELDFGDATVMLADEFPDLGVLSPLSIGGTATVLHLAVEDADAVWQRA